jgi:hypothetical protein
MFEAVARLFLHHTVHVRYFGKIMVLSELFATVSLVFVVCAAGDVLPSTFRTSLVVGLENGKIPLTTSLSDTCRKKREDYPKSKVRSTNPRIEASISMGNNRTNLTCSTIFKQF